MKVRLSYLRNLAVCAAISASAPCDHHEIEALARAIDCDPIDLTATYHDFKRDATAMTKRKAHRTNVVPMYPTSTSSAQADTIPARAKHDTVISISKTMPIYG